MPTLSTNELDQTNSQIEEIFYGSIVPFQVICADRIGPLDMCVFTLDRTFSN